MGKLISFMHTSLDGFVAGPNGEMDWIYIGNDMFDLADTITDKAGTALYGRKTYEMMESYWPTAGDQPDASKHDIHHSKWYNNVPKVVLSRTINDNLPNTTILSGNLSAQIEKLKSETDQDIVIFGSPSATHALFNLGLVDELRILMNPVVLGKGIPLFHGVPEKHQLKLIETKTFESVVALHYAKA